MRPAQVIAKVVAAILICPCIAVLFFGWQPMGPRSLLYASLCLASFAISVLVSHVNSKP